MTTIPQFKFCKNCKETKPIALFRKKRNLCKPCYNLQRKHNRPPYKYIPEEERAKHLRETYRMTPEEYEIMLQQQRGVCAACGCPETVTRHGLTGGIRNLAVDHNHETGQVRGLLCLYCNRALGCLKDSPERVEQLLNYIRKFV